MDKSFVLSVEIDEKSLTNKTGQFTIQPLERGYGITLGNAMRRVLLTSIPGPAITHVKIEGIQHEFSSITGVKEDGADIIIILTSSGVPWDREEVYTTFTKHELPKIQYSFKVRNRI